MTSAIEVSARYLMDGRWASKRPSRCAEGRSLQKAPFCIMVVPECWWRTGVAMDADEMQVGRTDADGRVQEEPLAGLGHHHHAGHVHHHGHEALHHHHHDEPMSQEEAVRSLLLLGQVALGSQDFESAVEAYASVLKLEQNETASYNLGSLYARGLGVRRDYAEAARLFHQAELAGNERAGKLCGKCMLDYVCEGIGQKSAADVYASMAVFVARVYPEASDQKAEVKRGLFAVASTCLAKGEYDEAAKVFRAGAEFGADGYAQYHLAQLYNAGAGLPRDDLAALYWLDCAVDNGAADVALADRDGMLAAYRASCSALEFCELMLRLSSWCEKGTPDVPANAEKAARWRAAV